MSRYNCIFNGCLLCTYNAFCAVTFVTFIRGFWLVGDNISVYGQTRFACENSSRR